MLRNLKAAIGKLPPFELFPRGGFGSAHQLATNATEVTLTWAATRGQPITPIPLPGRRILRAGLQNPADSAILRRR